MPLVTHRHLHLELIFVELEEDVRERPLQERGGPQNQDELEVAWEGALGGDGRGDSLRHWRRFSSAARRSAPSAATYGGD